MTRLTPIFFTTALLLLGQICAGQTSTKNDSTCKEPLIEPKTGGQTVSREEYQKLIQTPPPKDTLIIKGTVIDSSANEPIPFAKVSIDSFTTTTDFDGNFVLKYQCATDKKFMLTVKYIGYSDYSVTIDKMQSSKKLKIYLHQNSVPIRVPIIYAPQEPMKKDK